MSTVLAKQGVPEGEAWSQLMKDMHSGDVVEINEATLDYFMDLLPPRDMFCTLTMKGGVEQRVKFAFCEGDDYLIGFWTSGDQCFCQRSIVMSSESEDWDL